jgi:hypothetical protein
MPHTENGGFIPNGLLLHGSMRTDNCLDSVTFEFKGRLPVCLTLKQGHARVG